MKRVAAILLLCAVMLLVAACGAEADPNAGVYDAAYAEAFGVKIEIEKVFENGFSLELKNGGKATFHYEGSDYSMKWTLEDGVFHAEGGGAALDGTLKEGIMVLQNVLDSGIDITLMDSGRTGG